MVDQIINSVEINIIYTVYITAKQFSWMKITKADSSYEILTDDCKKLSREGLETALWRFFVKVLNQIESIWDK